MLKSKTKTAMEKELGYMYAGVRDEARALGLDLVQKLNQSTFSGFDRYVAAKYLLVKVRDEIRAVMESGIGKDLQ